MLSVAKAMMMQEKRLDDEKLVLCADSRAIPFEKVVEAIEFMRGKEPFAKMLPLKLMFELLFLSGMRVLELDNTRIGMLYGNVLYWQLGKRQKALRRVVLPDWFLEELRLYRMTCRVYGDRLFGIDANTMRHYFNKLVRPYLSAEWQIKELCVGKRGFLTKEYVYNLKGARKNFMTLLFYKKYAQYHDSHMAVLMTAREAHHKSERITAAHYVCNFESLRIDKLQELNPASLLTDSVHQKRLVDFGLSLDAVPV